MAPNPPGDNLFYLHIHKRKAIEIGNSACLVCQLICKFTSSLGKPDIGQQSCHCDNHITQSLMIRLIDKDSVRICPDTYIESPK